MLPSNHIDRLGPCEIAISWLNPTPHTIHVRFAAVVTFHDATLTTGRASPLTRTGFAPAGSRQPPGARRGRDRDFSLPPAQIPACGFPAPGSCRRSGAIGRARRLLRSADPQAGDGYRMPSPVSAPGASPVVYHPSDRAPFPPRPPPPLIAALFGRFPPDPHQARPTPRLFHGSFGSSPSCRGPGSPQRLRARRGLPGSNAILSCVMWPQTPAGRQRLA